MEKKTEEMQSSDSNKQVEEMVYCLQEEAGFVGVAKLEQVDEEQRRSKKKKNMCVGVCLDM